jgi:glycosyltransferase involved in cell wall biosynthesis
MRILATADPELPVPPKLYGGIERIVDLLVRGLKARGHEVALVAHRDSSCPADKLFHWPGLRSQDAVDVLRNTVALYAAVREFRPDVLHSFSRALYMLPLYMSSLAKVMSYQRPPGLRQIRLASVLGGRTLTFTGCSEFICKRGQAAGGLWLAIHNFVDLDSYQYQPEVPSDAPLVFLSRIERIKGAHTAIEVALKTGRRLLIAGNHGESGQEGRYWREEIAPYLGRNGVEYVGPVNDAEKNQLLGSAAAMIVPIEWDEPFGIVFAEALACGTPVISCPRGALPEIIRHGTDGFLVQSVADACAAVEKLPGLARQVCRERAERCFSAPVIVSKYEQLYASAVGGKA